MDMNANIDPKLAGGIILSLFLGFGASMKIIDKRSEHMLSTFFLEETPQGLLSAQMDDQLLEIENNQVINHHALSDFDAHRLMGNVSYFEDGDILIRQGLPEHGIKSYLSLRESQDKFIENQKEYWDYSEESKLSKCNLNTKNCSPLNNLNIPWRYRTYIDNKSNSLFLSEGTNHKIKLFSLDGIYKTTLNLKSKFPKRVRKINDKYYAVDTNNHQITFFNLPEKNSDISHQKTIFQNNEGKQWTIDAVFFDKHWWVTNADNGMTNAELFIFDEYGSEIKKITLPNKADPFDMLVYKNTLLISDIHLGNIYVFDSVNSDYKILSIPKLKKYADHMSKSNHKFLMLNIGIWIVCGLVALVLLIVAIKKSKNNAE